MPKQKTHEQFLSQVEYNFGGSLEVLTNYKNAKTKVKVRCKMHNHMFDATPNDLCQGHGCPKCGGSYKKSHEDFVSELYLVNKDIEVIGEYVNDSVKICFRCVICGHDWVTSPNSVLRGTGCAKCAKNLQKTPDSFREEVKNSGAPIQVIGDYVHSKHAVRCKCLRCGNDSWMITPNQISRKIAKFNGCPACSSKGFKQHEMAQFYVYDLGSFIGYGVTNVPYYRHSVHRTNFKVASVPHRLIFCLYGLGRDILALETAVKRMYNSCMSNLKGFKHENMSFADWSKFEVILDRIQNSKEWKQLLADGKIDENEEGKSKMTPEMEV